MSKDKYDTTYKIGRTLCKSLFEPIYNPLIINSKVIPEKGSAILCGNHLHVWDQVPVMCATGRTIHWMAKKEYFDGKLGFMYKAMGCIPVDRYGDSSVSKQTALDYLENGNIVGLFPEGTRNTYELARLNIQQKKQQIELIKEELKTTDISLDEIKYRFAEKQLEYQELI